MCQDLEHPHESGAHVGPLFLRVHMGPVYYLGGSHAGPAYCLGGIHVGPHEPYVGPTWDQHTIYMRPAHKIYLIIFYIPK